MKITILSIAPEQFEWFLKTPLIARNIAAGLLNLQIKDIRDYAPGSFRKVDDSPYGGGAGMLMKVDVVHRALLDNISNDYTYTLLTSPKARPLKQEDLIKDTENNISRWLIEMVSHITGVSIEGMQGVLMHMINCAMRELDNSRNFVIKVSPDDYEEVLRNKDNIYGALNPGIQLEIFEDSKLSKMQCLIDTDNGIVDVSLDAQLDNLKKALKMMIKENKMMKRIKCSVQ